MAAASTHGVTVDTEALLALRHLARARRTGTARLTGLPGGFVSKRRGRGLEPDEIRAYAEGDDIRHIDRNVTARTGIPHVRTFRDERDRTLLLIADFRAPMRWGTRRAFRSVAAAEALALAGWQACDAGARVGLIAFGGPEPVFVPARGRERAMAAISGALAAAHAQATAVETELPLDQALDLVGAFLPAGGTALLATGLDHPGPGFDHHAGQIARRGRLDVLLIRDAFETCAPPGFYPYVDGEGAIAIAAIGAIRQPAADPRIARLERLGLSVYPIDAVAGPEAMELPDG